MILFGEVPDAPASPQFLSRSGGDRSTGAQPFIQLAWTKPEDNGGLEIKAMRVYAKETSALEPILVYEGNATNFKFDSDLIAGITYEFSTSALNEAGESDQSAAIEVMAATIPPPMDTLVLTDKELNGSESSITVSWSVPSATGGSVITGYLVQINQGYGTSYLDPILKTETNHIFLDLQEGVTYKVRIAAINAVYSNNPLTDSALVYSSPALSVTLAEVP